MYFRSVNALTYRTGIDTGFPIPPFGQLLLFRFGHYAELYGRTIERAAGDGRSLEECIRQSAGAELTMEAFQGGGSTAFWNHLAEMVRVRQFPNLPSRLESVFAFTAVGDARAYSNHPERRRLLSRGGSSGNRDRTIVCEVRCDEPQRTACFDMALFDGLSEFDTLSEAVGKIEEYWRGSRSASPVWETLLEGEVFYGPVVEG